MIHDVHNKWCYDNGYPMRSYKPGPGRPKLQAQASSAKLQELLAASLKPQATSGKLQAASLKLHDTRALIKFQATSVR